MPQRDDSFMSETGNWNVASDYAKLKIMKPLWLADEYELISIFGTSDFIDELELNISPDALKIKGFQRLVTCLIMLIDNSIFAVKKDRGRPELEELKKELKKIDKIIPQLYFNRTNQIKKTKEVILKRDIYDVILNRVREIKAEINQPLNQNHLIFVDRKEFDPVDFKNMIKDRMINRG